MTSRIDTNQTAAIGTPDVPGPNAPKGLGGGGLTALSVGYFLGTMLFAIANVTLPDVGRRLHAGPASQTLVIGAFGAVYASVLVLSGRLGDNLGRRTVFRAGLVGVAVISVLAALATDVRILIVLRALQGAAAAAFTAQILSTIQAVESGPRRARAVAIVVAVAGGGFTGGQLAGGALVSADIAGSGWRSVYLLVAVVALAAALVARALPQTRATARVRLDHVGATLLTAALLLIVIGLSLGSALGWPWWSAVLIVAGLAVGAVLARHQTVHDSRGGAPILPPAVLRQPAMRLGLLLALLFFAVYGAFVYEFAVVSEGTIGLTPLVSGLTLLPYGLAFVLTTLLQPRVVSRLGGATLSLGAVIQGLALLVLAFVQTRTLGPTVWAWWMQPALVVAGIGQALQMGPLVGRIMAAVPDRIAGLTGGLVATTQQAALALGAAGFGGGMTALATSLGGRPAFAWALVAEALVAGVFAAIALRLARAGQSRATDGPRCGQAVDAGA